MTTMVIFTSGGIVNSVFDARGVEYEFEVVDDDSWEDGECPVCRGESVKLVDAVKMPEHPQCLIGGHYVCGDCGADENDDVQKLLEARARSRYANGKR